MGEPHLTKEELAKRKWFRLKTITNPRPEKEGFVKLGSIREN